MEPLIEIRNLKVHFDRVRAVDDVSFDIPRGQTLGLVGESGSGKSTIGRSILRVQNVTDGSIRFHNGAEPVELTTLRGQRLRDFRRHLQLIFQDPYASLNPRMTVRDIISEPLTANGLVRDTNQVNQRVQAMARRCKLNVEHLRRFPHAFSGGQRQRIGIARALVGHPEFVVCDESVSALDVSIQAEILNLLMDLQQELGTTFMFIAHDLSVVAKISSLVAVMYVGDIVELAPTRNIFFAPKHPYTSALLSAIPRINPSANFQPVKLPGEVPNPAALPPGCRFQTRCPHARERCRNEAPAWREIDQDHFVACHFAGELALRGADDSLPAQALN